MADLDGFLGKKIRLYRTKVNWPLKTLASHLGISLQQLQRYELGENKVSASMMFVLANIFNMPITAFYDGYHKEGEIEVVKKENNILLIEDDANDEFLLRKALSEFPEQLNVYSIHNCNDALEFFRKLSNNEATDMPKPSVIFLDLFIHNCSGLTVLCDIKRRSLLRDTPVIILTNSPNLDDIKEAYKLQASGFIRKSFDFKKLKQQLFKALNYWIKTVILPL